MTVFNNFALSARPKKVIIIITITAQKMKFSIKDFFSKCDQIHRNLRLWSHLLKKSILNEKLSFLCSFDRRSEWTYIDCFFMRYSSLLTSQPVTFSLIIYQTEIWHHALTIHLTNFANRILSRLFYSCRGNWMKLTMNLKIKF